MPPPGADGGPPPGVAVVAAGTTSTVEAPAPVTSADAAAVAVMDDPGQAYTSEVKTALIDAMIDYGTTVPIADDQWLTIAARDNEDARLGGDPYDVSTIILRIRGSDLAAYRAGRVSKPDVLKRVEIREY